MLACFQSSGNIPEAIESFGRFGAIGFVRLERTNLCFHHQSRIIPRDMKFNSERVVPVEERGHD